MPNEHQFHALVSGFANTSADFKTWAEFLNIRVMMINAPAPPPKLFDRTAHKHIPVPPWKVKAYRALDVSIEDAATKLADIADCQEAMIATVAAAFGFAFAPGTLPPPAQTTLGALTGPQLLHLILGWQQLDLGIFKTLMRLYGQVPSDPTIALHPGLTSDQRLAEVIVSWLVVIQADANDFVTVQNFNKQQGPKPPQPGNTPLADLEQQYHRLVNNYLLLLAFLPYHLHRANP
jgi:hypothetical protein